MQNRKPHSQKAPQTGHSIFGTILFSLLAVLAVEFLLLTFAVHATRLGPQLNQNAEDILAMQVDNCSCVRCSVPTATGSRVLRTKALRCASTVPIPTATSSAMPSTLLRSPP